MNIILILLGLAQVILKILELLRNPSLSADAKAVAEAQFHGIIGRILMRRRASAQDHIDLATLQKKLEDASA